jgi:hypothetical protein
MQIFLWDGARGEAKGANYEQEQPEEQILVTNRNRKQQVRGETIIEQPEDPNVVRNSGQKYNTPNQPIVIDDDIEIDPDEPILIFNLLSLKYVVKKGHAVLTYKLFNDVNNMKMKYF